MAKLRIYDLSSVVEDDEGIFSVREDLILSGQPYLPCGTILTAGEYADIERHLEGGRITIEVEDPIVQG